MNAIRDRAHFAVTRIDDGGVWASGSVEGVYDVLFDGRRIWSFWFLRDSEEVDEPGCTRVAWWPRSLRRYLEGRAHITVREHVDETVVFEQDVRFGDSDESISIIDSDGYALATDKTGELQRVFAEGDQRDRVALLDTIEDVLEALREIGVSAFPAYGTLLGAVRNGALIGHDSDADLVYVSDLTNPTDLIRESYRIDRHLRARGYAVERHSGFAMKTYIEEEDGAERGLDLFGGAYIGDKLYVMGEICAGFGRERVYPLATCTLEGRTLPAPADADGWLEMTYGPNWRVPDPAFHFTTPVSTRRRFDGWFRGTRRFRGDWERYWQRARAEPAVKPTNFTEWVVANEPDTDVVVDLGSGRGIDAMWYASTGRRAIGLDYSHSAQRYGEQWAQHNESSAEFAMLNLCDMRSVLGVGAWIAGLPGKRAIAARLMACSLDHRGRRNFWRLCSMVGRGGTRIYIQVVDPNQRGRRADPVQRLLRPVTTARILEEIDAAGGQVLEQVSLDPGSDDRPRYTRMVVTWQKHESASTQ